jgi:hypothetical protein
VYELSCVCIVESAHCVFVLMTQLYTADTCGNDDSFLVDSFLAVTYGKIDRRLLYNAFLGYCVLQALFGHTSIRLICCGSL